MGFKEDKIQTGGDGMNDTTLPVSVNDQKISASRVSNCSSDKDSSLLLCRVCHCAEPDIRGEAALGFLGIRPPSLEPLGVHRHGDSIDKISKNLGKKDSASSKNLQEIPGFLEFVSPEGEVFVCSADVESGSVHQEDTLISLGCSCKNELAIVHYACALKWFISHGSTICEICGSIAENVRLVDFKKVLASLKDYEALRRRTATGEISHWHLEANMGVDPDAVAGIRRQRLSEISSWFNPNNSQVAISIEHIEQESVSPSNNLVDNGGASERTAATRWAMEGTGVFVAIGLGTIVLTWLVAPHVGKKAALIGLHMLLGGLCALSVMIFLRFVVPRINYGPLRYWAILFIFWFLVFGVWASRTHSIRSS